MAYNLKSEEEVKEFLKNLYIEYKFGCLSEKRPEGKCSSVENGHITFHTEIFVIFSLQWNNNYITQCVICWAITRRV